MIPASLQYPANPLKISSGWVRLSEELFGELSIAVKAPTPPDAAVLLAEFEKWQQFAPVPGPNVVDKATVALWLEAYAVALEQKETDKDAYTLSAARLLRGRGATVAVPFVVASQNRSSARVLRLELVSISGGAGGFWLHPSFAHRHADMQAETGQFLTAITGAWASACSQCPSAIAVDVFWRLTTEDGGALPALQLDGPSASAAAFRAFWHITRALQIDPGVYVIADATSSDGRIEAVGQLREKINCIQAAQSSHKACPPTLVAAQRLSDDDLAAFRGASEWAEVVQVATIKELTVVRSVTVNAAKDYLTHLAEHWDKTPWYRNGVQVRLSEVHITPHVWKPKLGFPLLRDAASADGRSEEYDWRPAGYASSAADREVGPRLEKFRQQERFPWPETFRNNEAITVIVGGPGSGKTSILQSTARILALQGLDEIERRATDPDDIDWPIQTDLDAWASLPGPPVETLERTVIDGLAFVETSGANRVKAFRQFMRRRLIQSKARTFFVLDALDQVSESKVPLLSERLQAIATHSRPEWPDEPDPNSKSKPCTEKLAREIMSRGTKILVSTRESGMRTHHEAMSFTSHISKLQAAALSAEESKELAVKWLGAEQAARLDTHVRANPSLSIVADSPLLLTLACLVQSEQPQRDLPETPAALYQEMMRLLAKGAWRSSGARSAALPDADELLDSLRPLAWQLFSRNAGVNRFDRGTLLDTIIRATGRSQVEATKLLAQIVELGFLESSGRQNGDEHFHFRHATFREFLAASHLVSRINRDGWSAAEVEAWGPAHGWEKTKAAHLLDAQAFEPAWEPLIVFIAGLIQEPLPMIEMFADRKKDDLYRHRLGLLCRCFNAFSSSQQAKTLRAMEPVFEEILRIARRCEHDDAGHRKPWLEWVEILLPSPIAVERMCSGLLALDGRYHGWTVSGKVQELLERVLVRGRVPASVVDSIARLGEAGERQWGVNTLRLALSLAEDQQRKELVMRFLEFLERPSTGNNVKVRIAEALSVFGDDLSAMRGGELLISLAQSESLEEADQTAAINTLPELLETSLAPIAAPILVENLLNPSKTSTMKGQYSPFWLAWKLIGKAEEQPLSPWSALFLTIVLFADREEDRLKLWAAQVLSRRSEPQLRNLGLETLDALVKAKKSHVWVYAARWLIENGPPNSVNKGREALFAEAVDHESPHQKEATAELLNMGAISPIGEPIQDAVREAVLREIESHGQNYGPRLDVSAAGLPGGNLDLEFFESNPAAVIKRLHTFNGPSPYDRKRDDPNEEKARHRYSNPQLLRGTRYWPEVLRCSIQAANECADADRDGHLGIVLYGATGSELLSLLQRTFAGTPRSEKTRHYLLEELYDRGWRVRFCGRQVVVLRRGQEEPRANADFGY